MTLVTISVKIEREILEKIDVLAREKNKNRSIIIREALEKHVMGNTNEPVIGNTIDKIELILSIGSQILKECKERRIKLEKELMRPLSPYEFYRLPTFAECRRINRAISELLRLSMEA